VHKAFFCVEVVVLLKIIARNIHIIVSQNILESNIPYV
jgi:hypothetical protein